jgi:peptide/nickel transport system substrate-binding protein
MDVVSQNFTKTHDLNETCLGTGPYSFVSWQHGASIHLKAWNSYWGTKAKLADVYILSSNDVNARLLMLQAGDADYIYLPIANEAAVNGNSNYQQDRSPSLNVAFFVFNYNMDSATANSQWGGVEMTDNFFQSVHMRLAFEHLFNASQFIHSVQHDNAIALNGVVPKGLPGYNASVPSFTYDLTAAKNEMMQVPNPNHPGQSYFDTGFTIPLFFNAGNTARQTACQVMQQGLQLLSGLAGAGPMSATVNGLDWGSAYLPTMQTPHNFMSAWVVGWAPDYADADDYAFPFLATGGTYPIGSSYNNASINSLVLAAGVELNMDVRTGMYMNLSASIHEDPPYIFISQPNLFIVMRSWVKGEYSNPMWSDMYYSILSK